MRKLFLVVLLLLLACRQSNPVVWQLVLSGRIYADPVVHGGTVYLAASSGQLLSANLQTGARIWEQKLDGGIVAAPAVSDRMVFAATQNGNVVALDKKNGAQLWQRKFGGNEGFEAPLTIIKDLLLVPSDEGRLYALSQKTGSTLWMHEGGGKYNTAAVASRDAIYIGGWNREFLSLKSDGTENWRFKATDRIVENAVIQENRIYFPSHDKFLYCLDVQTGRLLWRLEATYPTNLLLFQDNLVFGSESYIYVVKATSGQLVRKVRFNTTIGRVAPAEKDCLVVTDRILRFDALRNAKAGAFRLPNNQKPFKAVAGGPLYLATDELYSVYAFSMERR